MIKFINAIYMMPAYHLVNVKFVRDAKAALCPCYLPWKKICTSGLAELQVKEERVDNVLIYDIKLSAMLMEPWLDPIKPTVFLCKDTEGKQYLIGGMGRPYPLTSLQVRASRSPQEGAVSELQIALRSPYPCYNYSSYSV